jgi:hypothetical protein
MPFTFAEITATYQDADGSPSTGAVEFTLAQPMTSGTVTMTGGSHFTAPLDASGNVGPLSLASTNDPDTLPTDVTWRVDERIDGVSVTSWFTPVPSGGVAVDLSTLRPTSAAWG